MAANIFGFLGFLFQLVALGGFLCFVGWQVRKVLNARAASRQQQRAKEVAAMVAASRSRQNARAF
ncbi:MULTISPECIES: hypothetical protein [unclassified Variovorax]|nr:MULTISPECIES: hypothetical protein [unclassified Variovorax]KWT86110.1 hypothetical protein APY03_3814 [Variovorax sp. WDL1]PNG50099.1 hypothetical protein CHC06_05722 [Variovorax sp. B2]PNG50971.1 hypothetical protein CHC07_05627 [Variovorax sp. B4]VTU44596.1 hypothetical protein H6P1_00799 [Variovorax sp. PBL-H6]VTU41815.1 hypothetical protein SRS16P1_00135 [Variovorax sp. SRS16]